MDSLKNFLDLKALKAREAGPISGPRHERALWVDETAKMLGKPFGQINGLTRKWSIQKIRDQYLEANKFDKNPAALWWKLRKETQ